MKLNLHSIISDRLGSSNRLRTVIQSENAECGLACLAMISGFHGLGIDLRELRLRFHSSLKGMTLEQILRDATVLGFTGRPVRCELEELNELRLPCILHWNNNHFVVLKSVTSRNIVILDPAAGERVLSWSEASKSFTGVALELAPKVPFSAAATQSRSIKWNSLIGKVVGLKRSLGQIFMMAACLEIFVLIAPLFSQWVIDHAIVNGDKDLLLVLGLGFGLLMLLRITIECARNYTLMVMSASLNTQWIANVCQHLLSLPVPFFEARHIGDIVSRFGSIHAIQQAFTTSLVTAILDGIMAIGLAIMLVIYSPSLSMICVMASICYLLLRLMMFNALRAASMEELIFSAKEQSIFIENIRGIQTLRVFGKAEDRLSRWLNTVISSKNCNLRTQRLGIIFRTAHELLFGAENIAVMLAGALMVINNDFSVGMLFAFVAYKGQFMSRISSLIDRMFEFKLVEVHSGRLADLVLSAPEPFQKPRIPVDCSSIEPSLKIKNLSFQYDKRGRIILNRLNFDVRPGQSMAIVGASGCGKTTLSKNSCRDPKFLHRNNYARWCAYQTDGPSVVQGKNSWSALKNQLFTGLE